MKSNIVQKGSGSHLEIELKKQKGCSIELIAEYVINEEKTEKLKSFMNSFLDDYQVIEHFGSFSRYKVNS